MALRDAFRSLQLNPQPLGLGGTQSSFTPTEPGDPDFSLATNPSSQAQYPAAAAQQGMYQTQTRALNQLNTASLAGFDTSQPQYNQFQTAADQGFLPRALTLGEKLLGWLDGPRQAVNLMIQDIVGGVAEEGFRDPTFGDYWNTLWGGMEDSEGFKFATGLEPRSGSKTLDMFGWSEEEDLLGRIGRGVVDFGLQVLTDPLSYVTFGMSALGKNVARATGTRFMDDVIKKILPAFDEAGNFRLSPAYLDELKASDTYTYNLVRELMEDQGDGLVSQFREEILEKIEAHGGVMPPEVVDAIKKRTGDEGAWMDDIVELAVANRVTKDVIQPLMARDFAKIDSTALEMLPKWAHGGMRIAVPFTQSSLSSGILVPGTQGLGKRMVGDPVRNLVGRLKGSRIGDAFDYLDDTASFFDTERSLNKALASGRLSGWQYATAMKVGLDRIANQSTREATIATLNVLGSRVLAAANDAGLDDKSVVWSKIMHNLEGYDDPGEDMILGQLDNILGGKLTSQKSIEDFSNDLLRNQDLDSHINALSEFLRTTFDGYHKALSAFDPEIKKQYIDNYAPHAFSDPGRRIVSVLSAKGRGIPKREWKRLQDEGNPGGVLLAQIINAYSKGGRLESSLGGSRYFNARDEGRFAAVALTDEGAPMLEKKFWEGLTEQGEEIIGPNAEVNATLRTKYAPASKLNEWVEPVLRKLAEDYNIKLPKDWDGKLFSEDPLELAIGYIHNLDQVVNTWNAVEALKAAGLAFRHETAPDINQVLQNMYGNAIRNTKKVLEPAAPPAFVGRKKVPNVPPEGRLVEAPASWLRKLVDPVDWKAAVKGKAEYPLENNIDYTKPVGERLRSSKKGTREEFIASLKAEGIRDPVRIGIDPNGKAIIINGHNRLANAPAAGIKNIPINFVLLKQADEYTANGLDVSQYLRKDLIFPDDPEALGGEFSRGVNADAIFEVLPWKPTKDAGKMGPLFHGAKGELPENLEALEAGVSGSHNLFGPAFYATNDPTLADEYRPTNTHGGITPPEARQGGRHAIEWTGEKPPAVIDMQSPANNEFRAAMRETMDEIEAQKGNRLGVPEAPTDVGDINLAEDWQKLRASVEDPRESAESLYSTFKFVTTNLGQWGDGWADDELPKLLNIKLRDKGIDALRYQGGARTGGRAHEAYAWLSMEKLRTIDITGAKIKNGKLVPNERRILKGYDEITDPIVPSITGPIREGGFDPEDVVGNRKLYQLSKLSRDEFAALRQQPYDKLPSQGFLAGLPDKQKIGWARDEVTMEDGSTLIRHTLRGKDGKVDGFITINKTAEGELESLDVATVRHMTPREGLAFSWKVMDQMDTALKDGDWNLSHSAVERLLQNEPMSDAGAEGLRLFLKRKINSLPDKSLEEFAKEPSEFVNTRGLADEFIDEFNLVFKEYAQLYDPQTGKLILDPSRNKVAGDTVFMERIAGLRKAARMADEAGWDTAVKIMSKIDDPMGLSEVDDFVNPMRFALAGPAVNDLKIQHDMAIWLRNYARNSAAAFTPEGVSAAAMASRTTLRWWKAMATIARPAFHIRNHLSATWANMTIGVRPQDYNLVRHNAVLFKNALKEGKGLDGAFKAVAADARPYFEAAWEKDIMSGFVSSELRTLTAVEKHERMSWLNVVDVDNFVLTRVGSKLMESIEDFHRMAAFVRWYDPKNPNTANVAKSMVERVHFNYANTTPLEDRLKAFIPFFVWTRRNIPLQVSTLVENPRFIQRYRAMMQTLNDEFSQEDENGMPLGDQFSAYAAGTDFYVNPGSPFWARVVIDPDLPVKDLLSLPNPSPHGLLDFGTQLLGPQLSTILDLNEQREFGDVNAPAPLNAVLKSLAFVGLYDETNDGDVRVPYWARTIAETAFPPGREIIDPLTGGPSDPNRQQRLGIADDDGTLEAALKTLAGNLGRGFGVKLNTPVDVRSVNARTNDELTELVRQLRLQGELPAAPEEGDGSDVSSLIDRIFG